MIWVTLSHVHSGGSLLGHPRPLPPPLQSPPPALFFSYPLSLSLSSFLFLYRVSFSLFSICLITLSPTPPLFRRSNTYTAARKIWHWIPTSCKFSPKRSWSSWVRLTTKKRPWAILKACARWSLSKRRSPWLVTGLLLSVPVALAERIRVPVPPAHLPVGGG